jgi:CubicO group peptidase (beta-lactamase class C family)
MLHRRPTSTRTCLSAVVVALAACAVPREQAAPAPTAEPRAAAPGLAADTPGTTNEGNTFIAPKGWSLRRTGDITLIEAPEPGSRIALVDVQAADAPAAVAKAWPVFVPGFARPLRLQTPINASHGWGEGRSFFYIVPPNEHRTVWAMAKPANGSWTVTLVDMAIAVANKRIGQTALIYGRTLPKGHVRETFAGRRAQRLTPERIAEITAYVERAMKATKVPGAAFGLIQDGKVVHAAGLGVRQIGKPDKVDADTKFLIASNTKPMVTLMLAKLVEQGRLSWDTHAVDAWPAFRLGSADATAKVRVRHLICACTGMPRRDFEWMFEYRTSTAADAMKSLASMQPTSDFGDLYQYSNPMAAAAGYLGGHVAFPGSELGAGYDRAMKTLVFDPLGMRDTTHDFDVAERGNAAVPHAPDIDGNVSLVDPNTNRSMIPIRPAGGAWSTVNDLLKLVAMELGEGVLPDGRRWIARDVLLSRREPRVRIGADNGYGMGLWIDTEFGTPVNQHGGFMWGFHSDIMWLPEHGVGAVILTNGNPGWIIRQVFHRKLQEVLFDGKAQADSDVESRAKAYWSSLESTRRSVTLPAALAAAADLAPRYANPNVGAVEVRRDGDRVVFDVGEWRSEVATRANTDGTTSFVTVAPGMTGFEFVVGSKDGKRMLVLRDAQHRYELIEQP